MSSSREHILKRLSGQVVSIPDLKPLMSKWPGGLNKNYEKLVYRVDRRLESLTNNAAKLAKLKRADFAFFASAWWPYANPYELETLAYLAIWLFLWDDEIDESCGSLANDFEASQGYRHDTSRFVEQALGLELHPTFTHPKHITITSFAIIGERLRRNYSIGQRKRFMREMMFFLRMSEREQRVRLSQHVPSVEEYWQCRMGTSATGVCAAVLEFALNLSLPPVVMRDRNMKIMWDECNVNVSITNDLLSLRKEIGLGCVDSLIPLSTADGSSVQAAVDVSVQHLEASIKRFDAASVQLVSSWCTRRPLSARRRSPKQTPYRIRSLISKLPNAQSTRKDVASSNGPKKKLEAVRSPLRKDVALYLNGLRQMCVGNLTWSLLTDRYGLSKAPRDAEGRIQIVLGGIIP